MRASLLVLAFVVLALPSRAAAQGLVFDIDVGPALGVAAYSTLAAATSALLALDLVEATGPGGRQHRSGGVEVAIGVLDLVAGVSSFVAFAGAGPRHRDLALGGAVGCSLAGLLLVALGVSAYALVDAPALRIGGTVTSASLEVELSLAL